MVKTTAIKKSMSKKIVTIFAVSLLIACINACDKTENKISYQSCNSLLYNCQGSGDGTFCTLGYKWGSDNPFTTAGLEIDGPGTPGGKVSYSFMPEGRMINTHSQTDLTSLSIDHITVCDPREQIRQALQAWEAVTNIEFEEIIGDSGAGDLRFVALNITQGGLGYPAFTDDLCGSIAGQIVIDVPTRNTCEGFYHLLLHEIGHGLGLGHVSTSNVMNPNLQNFTELQTGDIQGIQSIYGKK